MQGGLLASLLVLIIVGFTVDVALEAWMPRVADALGIRRWLQANIALPGDDTLRHVLDATAAATGTILGLVLSISLIVWQVTAERYASGRIVQFLLRERIGSAVVRVLALAFAYSLWVLALLELVRGHRPYFSALIALLLSTIGVLSLLTYRTHALFGYLPGNTLDRLRREVITQLARATAGHAGRSVHDYARRVVRDDLQTTAELLRRLTHDHDLQGVLDGIHQLDNILITYLQAKCLFADESLWFERRAVRLTATWTGIPEIIAAEGLMDATTPEPDRFWLERAALGIVDEIQQSSLLDEPAIVDALSELLAHSLQAAWHAQELEACDMVLREVESLAAKTEVLSRSAATQGAMTVLWILVEISALGLSPRARAVIKSRPWRGDARVLPFPWLVRQQAVRLGTRVRREIAIAGRRATPDEALLREMEREWSSESISVRDRYLRVAFDKADAILRGAVANGGTGGVAAARSFCRILLRSEYHGLHPRLAADIATVMIGALRLADSQSDREDLRKDYSRVARVCVEAQQWELAYAFTGAAMWATALSRAGEADEHRKTVISFDGLVLLALVHAWAELRGRTDNVIRLSRYFGDSSYRLQPLLEMINRPGFSTALLPLPAIEYHQWFQGLLAAARSLPDRYENAGRGIPIVVGKEHGSDLFRRWQVYDGYDECLAHLIRAVVELRALHVRSLLGILSVLAAQKAKE